MLEMAPLMRLLSATESALSHSFVGVHDSSWMNDWIKILRILKSKRLEKCLWRKRSGSSTLISGTQTWFSTGAGGRWVGESSWPQSPFWLFSYCSDNVIIMLRRVCKFSHTITGFSAFSYQKGGYQSLEIIYIYDGNLQTHHNINSSRTYYYYS